MVRKSSAAANYHRAALKKKILLNIYRKPEGRDYQ